MKDWLNLSEAAEILGVHPSTLRNWSNQGLISVHYTQGGHRRFQRNELEQWLQSQHVESPGEIRLVAQNALRSTRFQISEGRLSQENWYNKLDEEARAQYRQSGRTMLQGLINFIDSQEKAISEAETIGYEYASRGCRYGLNNVEATQAFLFFRNVLMDSLLDVFDSVSLRASPLHSGLGQSAPATSAATWMDLYHKMTIFTDEILVTLLETYEVYRQGSR
jgi:excisionase family DNA binding protein